MSVFLCACVCERMCVSKGGERVCECEKCHFGRQRIQRYYIFYIKVLQIQIVSSIELLCSERKVIGPRQVIG